MAARDFTLDDFRKELDQLQTSRTMKDIAGTVPGMIELVEKDPSIGLVRLQGMLAVMTDEERQNPEIIDKERVARIADDAGVDQHEVKQFLRQFFQVQKLMRRMNSMSLWQRIKLVTGFGKKDLSDD